MDKLRSTQFWSLIAIGILCVGVGIWQGVIGAFGNVVAAALVFLFLVAIWIGKNISTAKKNMRIAGLDKNSIPVRYEINEKKIVTLNRATAKHKSYHWSEIRKAVNTRQYLYLYTSKTQAAVINKRHIVEGSEEQLCEWAKALVGQNREKNKGKGQPAV